MQSSWEGVTHFLQAEFRDEGLKHETSALKLFTVTTTVSLENYPLYSFVPDPTYYLCSAHTIALKASQSIHRKPVKKKSLMRGLSFKKQVTKELLAKYHLCPIF